LNKFFKKDKIEETALRFFDMFGWLIRSLTLDGVNLWKVLSKVGEQHNRMKIRPNHYQYLLEAFHYAMSESFSTEYTIQVKYSIDQIFTVATCIMTGYNFEQLSFGQRVLQLNECTFLKSLSTCLESEIGREYLYRYLGQCYCEEIVIFLQLLEEYKQIGAQHPEHHCLRLLKAKNIAKISLSDNGQFPINVSYCAMVDFWARLNCLKRSLETDATSFRMDEEIFDTIYTEVTSLILMNHWRSFVQSIKKMQKQQQNICTHHQ